MTLVAGCYERFLFGFSCDAGGEQVSRAARRQRQPRRRPLAPHRSSQHTAAGPTQPTKPNQPPPPPTPNPDPPQTERAPLRRTFTHAAHKGVVKALAAAGPFVASGGADDLIHLYDLKADKDLGFLMNPGEGAVTALSFFTPPGRYAPSHLLAGCSDGSVSVWRAGGGWECLKSLRGHRREVTALAVHPSGRLALSTSRDGCLRMWDMVKGRSTFTARLDGEGEGVAFAPGGATYAVTCGAVVTVHAAGGGGGGVLASLRHPRRVLCAAFGPTGRCVVTGSEDGSLRVWDAAAGEEVLCISRAHATRIKALTLPHAPPEAAPAAAQGAGGGGGGGELEELAAAVPALVATASSDGVVKMWALRDAVLAQLQRGGLGGGGAAADDGGAAACVGQAATRARLTVLCSVDPLDEMERRFQEQAETKQREHDQRKKSKKAAVAAAAAAEAPAGERSWPRGARRRAA
jgi:hypothetical protein